MKVCAVIVTYGDRFHLLNQVMDTCYKEGVNNIIVVDNNSSKNSKIELKKYE
jgi:cellulose synthase/poly-beta-1,6-N-acetylglucosamine synthase-like glycosyltransferase